MKVLIVDDDRTIRESLKNAISIIQKTTGKNIEIYTAGNGLEGLGLVYVLKPEVVVLDTTLPELSGKEIFDLLKTNDDVNKICNFKILHESKNIQGHDLPSNYKILTKSSKTFTKEILIELAKECEGNLNLTTWEKVQTSIVSDVIKWSNSADVLVHKGQRLPWIFKFFVIVAWIILQIYLTILTSALFLFVGRTRDSNIQQQSEDDYYYRVKTYPSLAVFFSTVFIIVFQIGLLIGGGAILFNTRIENIFATGDKEAKIEFNVDSLQGLAFSNEKAFEANSNAIKLTNIANMVSDLQEPDSPVSSPSEIISSPTLITETSSENSPKEELSNIEGQSIDESNSQIETLEDSSGNSKTENVSQNDGEILPNGAEDTGNLETQKNSLSEENSSEEIIDNMEEPTIEGVLGVSESREDTVEYVYNKNPIYYSDLYSIFEISNQRNENTSLIEIEPEVFEFPELTYQLSPNSENWYYFNEKEGEWSEDIDPQTVFSNNIYEVNSSLELYEELFEEGALYIKVIFTPNEEGESVELSELRVELNRDMFIDLNEEPNEPETDLVPVSVPNSMPISTPVSSPSSIDSPTSSPEEIGSELSVDIQNVEVQIFNASFFNGEKVVRGKVFSIDSELVTDKLSSLEDYSVIVEYQDGEYIGETGIYVNQRGEIEFTLRTANRAGGFVTAYLVENGEQIITQKALTVENSTFTVDSTLDSTDLLIDGLCDDGIGNCTLRAAIQEANALAGSDDIHFNIPTTDPGYFDIDGGAGDGVNGDDYWRIPLGSDLPVIISQVLLAGATQASNQGDLNLVGPEIVVDGSLIGGLTLFSFDTGADGSSIDSLGILNADTQVRIQDIDGFEITNSYIGVDADGSTVGLTTQNVGVAISAQSTNVRVGNTTSDGNVIGGMERFNNNSSGISVFCNDLNASQHLIRGNKIGISSDETTVLSNERGISITQNCDIEIGGDQAIYRNIISGNENGIIKPGSATESESNILIQNNFFGTDSTGTQNFANTNNAMNISGTVNTTVDSYNLEFRDNLVRFSPTGVVAFMERNYIFEGNTFANHSNTGLRLLINTQFGTGDQADILIQNNAFGQFSTDPNFGINTGANGNANVSLLNSYALIQDNIINGGEVGISVGMDQLMYPADIGRVQMVNNQLIGQSVISVDNQPTSGVEANPRVTLNDEGDVDDGANALQNFPEIKSVTYLGSNQYQIMGTLDGNVSEAPFEIEICAAETAAPSGYGGCLESIGTVTTSATPTLVSGPSNFFDWSITVTNTNNEVFSALSTNSLGETSEFSQNVFLADANPVFNLVTSEWEITVTTTTDEDNVSIIGTDDGDGVYSGGGLEGVDGVANGLTSLREAITVANNFVQPVTIIFDIPTSDARYLDIDGGTGDNLDGDDYWSIELIVDLPSITSEVVIDGATQTINQGNLNTNGKELEIDGNGVSNIFILDGAHNVTINDLALNNSTNSAIYTASPIDSLTLYGNFINTDVLGTTDVGTAESGIHFDDNITNFQLGVDLTNPNIITGNLYGVRSQGSGNIFTGADISGQISGNYFGIGSDGSSYFGTPDSIRLISFAGDTFDLIVGDALDINRGNYIGGIRAVNLNPRDPNHNIQIYHNVIGTGVLGTEDTCGNVGIRINSGNVLNNNLVIGSNSAPNFISNCNSGIWFNNNIQGTYEVVNNYFSGNGRGVEVTYNDQTVDDDLANFQILNNQFGAGTVTTALEFGLPINDNVDSNEFATDINWGSIDVRGGNVTILGNEFADENHVAVRMETFTFNRLNATDNKIPEVSLGGVNALVGSRCNGNENNCFLNSSSSYPATMAFKYYPGDSFLNENDFTQFNTGTNLYEEYWPIFFEVFSGDIRRTDLISGERAMVPLYTQVEMNCLEVSDCPAATSADGTAGTTFIWVRSDNFDEGLYDANSLVDGVFYDDILYRSLPSLFSTQLWTYSVEGTNFLVINSYSPDGDATTQPVNSGPARISNGFTYFDYGEPWTSDPTATANPSLQDFTFNDIYEMQMVDANPRLRFGSSEWEIIVNTTGDEDNVSLEGLDDGDGAYSGGGVNGPDGLPNGKTSLREAIYVANQFGPILGETIHIRFNIPETEPGYLDIDGGIGDSLDGDDYWSIEIDSLLPNITSDISIEGATQTLNRGNTNIEGPEIEINANGLINGLIFEAGGIGSVDSLVINNSSASTGSALLINNTTDIIVTNSYLGLNVLGTDFDALSGGVDKGLSILASTNIQIGNDETDGNVISGLENAVEVRGQSEVSFRGNKIGYDKNVSTALIANRTMLLETSGTQSFEIGGPLVVHRNYIQNGTLQTIYVPYSSDFSESSIIQNNYIGSDPFGNLVQRGTRAIMLGDSGNYTGVAPYSIEIKNNLIMGAGYSAEDGAKAVDVDHRGDNHRILISENTITDSRRCVESDTAQPTTFTSFVEITNNYCGGNGDPDPYFGVTTTPNFATGFQIDKSRMIIQGNILEGGNITPNAIISYLGSYEHRNDPVDSFSYIEIGGTNPLPGSLCEGLEKNCINDYSSSYIWLMDSHANNETSILTDNNFTQSTPNPNAIAYLVSWTIDFELFSGIFRRTDIADGTAVGNLRFRLNENELSVPMTLLSATCTDISTCPATGTEVGANGETAIVFTTSYFNSEGSSLKNIFTSTSVEGTSAGSYYVRFDGTIIGPSENQVLDSPHFASRGFTWDGDSTTDPLATAAPRIVGSFTFEDRGEPWTNDPTQAKDVSTPDYGRNQVMELEYVDANPIFNQITGEWEITVNSTSDENNVWCTQAELDDDVNYPFCQGAVESDQGFDDGSGFYSGGGIGGPDGLPNGLTTLREAILVANNFNPNEPIRIIFNIPTSDPNYNNNFSGAFQINLSTGIDLDFDDTLIIDGASQTIATGDSNTAIFGDLDNATVGPEIIITYDTNAYLRNYGPNLNINNIGFYNSETTIRALRLTTGTVTASITNTDFIGNLIGAFYADENATNVTLTNNVFRDNNSAGTSLSSFDAVKISFDGGNHTIEDNYFINNGTSGLRTFESNNTTGEVTIANNIFKGNGFAYSEAQLDLGPGTGTVDRFNVQGNLFSDSATPAIRVNNSVSATLRENIFNDIDSIHINLNGGIEDIDNVTINDPGDTDIGANNLQNHPEMTVVQYLGSSQYRVIGRVDGNVSEAPFEIEICESDNHPSGHGGCIQSLGFVATSSVTDEVEGISNLFNFSTVVTLPGSNSLDTKMFSGLATNNNGSTSEFSPPFGVTEIVTPTTEAPSYIIFLISPIAGVEIEDTTPTLEWAPSSDPAVDYYEVYLNGNEIAEVTGTSYTIPTELAVGDYEWQIIAIRTDNSLSGQSVIETFTIASEEIEVDPEAPGEDEDDNQNTPDDEPTQPTEDDQNNEDNDNQENQDTIGGRVPIGDRDERDPVDIEDLVVETTEEIGREDERVLVDPVAVLIIGGGIVLTTLGAVGATYTSGIIGVLIGWVWYRHEKYWGFVYDRETENGIALAVVRLYERQETGTGVNRKLEKEVVTDFGGRYGFIVDKEGLFEIEVRAEGYRRHQGILRVSENLEVIYDVGMDKIDKQSYTSSKVSIIDRIRKARIESKAKVLEYLNYVFTFLMLFGLVYTIYAITIDRTIQNMVLLIIYSIIVIFNLLHIYKQLTNTVGNILDKATGEAVPNVRLRLYKNQKQVLMAMSNQKGEIKENIEKGEYIIRVDKRGYKTDEDLPRAEIDGSGRLKQNLEVVKI